MKFRYLTFKVKSIISLKIHEDYYIDLQTPKMVIIQYGAKNSLKDDLFPSYFLYVYRCYLLLRVIFLQLAKQ